MLLSRPYVRHQVVEQYVRHVYMAETRRKTKVRVSTLVVIRPSSHGGSKQQLRNLFRPYGFAGRSGYYTAPSRDTRCNLRTSPTGIAEFIPSFRPGIHRPRRVPEHAKISRPWCFIAVDFFIILQFFGVWRKRGRGVVDGVNHR